MPEDVNPFENGPYIQVAGICEKVLKEPDGVMSLIRLVDVVKHEESGVNPPNNMPSFDFPLYLVVNIKAGTARGRHEITITPEKPSGETLAPHSVTVRLDGANRGQNITTQLRISWDMEGLWWFRVDFDEMLFTKLPLDVQYSRLSTGTASI